MPLHKRIEWVAKLLLALFAAVVLWRPGRKARARRTLGGARRLLLVRVDDRVGEALLTTPLLTALSQNRPEAEVHVLVHPKVIRVLEGHPAASRLIAFDRRWLWLGAWAPGIRALRAEGYEVVINCANWQVPSVTSGIISRLVAARAALIGPAAWPVGWLADVAVEPREGTLNEVLQRLHLLSPLGAFAPAPLSFRRPRVGPALESLLGEVGSSPHAIVNPGGRLGWRRIPAEAFGEAARALVAIGRRPLITWGPGEEDLAREIASLAPGAVLAPATDLDELAALMAAAGLTVCNNTGPMHLSVAVGAPTLALFLRMSLERWGHPDAPHRMVDLTALSDAGGDLGARIRGEVTDFAGYLSGRTDGTAPSARQPALPLT